MVINTFHYSGNASTNVTITGLPRAKELITAADSSSTANMLVREDNLDLLHPRIVRDMCRLVCEPSTSIPKQFAENACIKGDLENLLITKLSVLQGIPKSILLKKKRKLKLSLNSPMSTVAIRLTGNITCMVYSKLLSFVGSDCYLHYCKDIVLTPVSWKAMDVPDALLSSSILELLAEYKIQGVKDIVTAQTISVFDTVIEQTLTKVKKSCIETLGSNLLDITDFSSFDSSYSNNVQEVTRVLGIEAGINVLQKELKKVLSFNDSYVSPRHILLLADTMGRSGSMCGLIRQKMSSMGNGVLHQASFEQTMEVLENAAIFGHIERTP
jgi:DNA-directed RNA polymerase beta' subunit